MGRDTLQVDDERSSAVKHPLHQLNARQDQQESRWAKMMQSQRGFRDLKPVGNEAGDGFDRTVDQGDDQSTGEVVLTLRDGSRTIKDSPGLLERRSVAGVRSDGEREEPSSAPSPSPPTSPPSQPSPLEYGAPRPAT